ncbi:hypothetical protein GQ42DRAFT_117090 [Ramicandelaber brevisporus]|nr:hypothetical protein GQ42DRAFT_117090 [Ramicandelaber brevisporus]
MSITPADVCLYVLAFFIPPVAVFIRTGASQTLLLNVVLWILGVIPGIVHAWYVIYTTHSSRVIQETIV